MCIDIVEIWFGIANEKSLSKIDTVVLPPHNNGGVFWFNVFIFLFCDALHV